MPNTTSIRLNAGDFAQLPQDRFRYEIIDGELFMSPSPKARHQFLLGRLHTALDLYLLDHPVGAVFLAPFDVHFGFEDIVEPDLIFIRRERIPEILRDWIYGVPDLLVEILSSSTERKLDRTAKFQLYESRGVADYWLADPERRRWEAYRLNAGRYEKTDDLGDSEVFTTRLFPGWRLELAGLWMPDSLVQKE